MSAEILINAGPLETRVALIDQGLLQEIYIERRRKQGPVGNIYRGKVVRVMPGMQAAFVDLGLERAGFIVAADIKVPEHLAAEGLDIPITRLLREGQMLVVQVVKDSIANKGARLTTHLSLASRHLVYMPGKQHIGVSQRIDNEEERERLSALLRQCLKEEELEEEGGFILRTLAESATAAELVADIHFLRHQWQVVEGRIKAGKGVSLVYQDLVLYMRAMRDLIRPDVKSIRVDDKGTYDEVLAFTREFMPEIEQWIDYYDDERPLFDLYGVDDEIEKALNRTVKLKSGGNLVIDQNEAMTTIDVNTGAYLGTRNQEETIFKTNLEAAKSIARQIKVRNLGGIIILDFIDMNDEDHQRQVLRTLTRELENDPAKARITQLSELGLVEMSRKRSRESLEQILCGDCPSCGGRGTIKTPETVCYELFREILRTARAYDNEALLVMVSQPVVDRILEEESATVSHLEKLTGKRINFQVESMYNTEQYDVVML